MIPIKDEFEKFSREKTVVFEHKVQSPCKRNSLVPAPGFPPVAHEPVNREMNEFVDWVLAYSHILYLLLEVADDVAVIDTRSKQRFNIRMLIHSGG